MKPRWNTTNWHLATFVEPFCSCNRHGSVPLITFCRCTTFTACLTTANTFFFVRCAFCRPERNSFLLILDLRGIALALLLYNYTWFGGLMTEQLWIKDAWIIKLPAKIIKLQLFPFYQVVHFIHHTNYLWCSFTSPTEAFIFFQTQCHHGARFWRPACRWYFWSVLLLSFHPKKGLVLNVERFRIVHWTPWLYRYPSHHFSKWNVTCFSNSHRLTQSYPGSLMVAYADWQNRFLASTICKPAQIQCTHATLRRCHPYHERAA